MAHQQVYLGEADHARVTEAVRRAELSTSGEIVTILADRSDGYTDVAMAWSAVAALGALSAVALMPDFYLGKFEWLLGGLFWDSWNHEWTPARLLWIAALVAALKFLGMMLVQLWPPLKYFLIPPPIKTARVHARAVDLFKVGAERRTHGRTGILIYLSMREHRAEVVADAAIADHVDDAVWGEAMVAMLAELKAGRTAEAMVAGVERVGAVLAEHFPRAEDDRNELPDRLIEL